MSHPSKRAELLDVIQRCAWLIEYYERTAVSPESVRALQVARDKAIHDLSTLTATDAPAAPQDGQNLDIECPTSPTESAPPRHP